MCPRITGNKGPSPGRLTVPCWLSGLEVNCQFWGPGTLSGHRRPNTVTVPHGKNYTTASCLHWLFIYDSKCLRNRTAISGTVFVEGGVVLVRHPHPTHQHCKRHPEDYTPSLPTCGSGPSRQFLGPSSQAPQQAACSKPGAPHPDRTPQSSAHLRHLCVAHLRRPPPTKPPAAPEEARAPSRLRHTCSALLK